MLNASDKHKEEVSAIVTDQLEIVEMYLTNKKLSVREEQLKFELLEFNFTF